MNAYAGEINEMAQVCTFTKRLTVVLDDKYKKSDLHQVKKR